MVADNQDLIVLDTVWINVTDTISPFIVSPYFFSFHAGTSGNSLTWQAYDASQGNYSIYQGETLVTNQTWQGEPLISINLDYLALGIYNFTLILQDTSQNFANDTVHVTVYPQSFTATDTSTKASSNLFQDPLIILGGIAGLGAVTVGGITLIRRKK